MAGRGDIKAGRAYVELFLKNKLTTQLATTLANAQKRLNAMASAANAVGGAFNKLAGFAFKAGGVITGPFLAALANMDEGKKIFEEIGQAITDALGPPLIPVLKNVRNVVVAFSDWAKRNPELIRTVFMIGASLLAAGAALGFVGMAAETLAIGLAAAAGVAGALASVVGFLATPFGALLAVTTAGIAAWAMWTQSGRAAVQTVINFFGPLIETARATITGIADALMGGDLTLAAQIAMKGLQLIFTEGLSQLSALLSGSFGDTVADIGGRIIQGDLKGAWDTTVLGMGALWAEFAEGMVAVFTTASRAVVGLWEQAVGVISDNILAIGAMLPESVQELVLGAKINPEDVAEAQKTARSITGGQADSMRGQLDEWDRAMQEQTKAIQQQFSERTSGAAGRTSEEAKRLGEELAALRVQAKEARDRAGVGPALPELPGIEAAMQTTASTVTFSGAGLLASGQGGGNPVVKAVDGVAKKIDKLIAVEEKMLANEAVFT